MNSKRRRISSLSLALILLATSLSACVAPVGGGATPVSTPAPTVETPGLPATIPTPLNAALLQNAKYELPDIGSVQLIEGKFEQKYGEGESQVNRGDFQRMVLGDLNGDGVQDAVVILTVNTGGSGSFVYMIVVADQNGTPEQVAVEILGDRVQIKALDIADGQLDVDFLGFGPEDPQYCPAQETTRTYRLQGETLTKIADSSPDSNTGALTEGMLQNGAYTLPDIGAIQLKDGSFEHKYGDGATQVNKVGYMQAVLGDLNGDVANDAAVMLWADTGGSGTFIYLVAVANQNGAPQQIAAELLGDRIEVQNFAIENGQIVIRALSHGPDDPMCCPSQLVIRTYRLEGGTLKVVSEVKPTAGADVSVVNTAWQWEHFDDTAGLNSFEVSDPTKYTLELLADGTYQVKADCNLGNGKYVLEEGSRIKLGPMAMTQAACAPDSLSDKYVVGLGDVVTYVLRAGKLYLNLKMDAGNMIFRQVGAPASILQPSQIKLDTQGLPYSWQAVSVPASLYDASQPPGPVGLPEHVEILFGAVTLAERQPGMPVLYIIPVDAYRQMWDNNGDPSVSSQIAKIDSLVGDLPSSAPISGWPALPVEEIIGYNDLAVQVARVIASPSTRGYRFVGRWLQDANPVTNQGLEYVYQGFTNDGKYLVAFFYPVTTSALPRTYEQVPAAELAKFTADPAAFIQQKAAELNALPPAAWEPDLTKLDALIGSLQIAEK